MKNTNPVRRFACVAKPTSIYTPAFLFEVEEMEKHPEYFEIDADGNAIVKKGAESVKTLPIRSIDPNVIAASLAKASAKPKKAKAK